MEAAQARDDVIQVDVRGLAATNKDLTAQTQERRFRDDLYYRLQVFPIRVPPLRDRREDILPLIEHCMARLNRVMGKSVRDVDGPTLQVLEAHHYPGNVRELENCLERASIMSEDGRIDRCLDHRHALEDHRRQHHRTGGRDHQWLRD